MFSFFKKGLILSTIVNSGNMLPNSGDMLPNSGNCLSLNDQKCKVQKTTIDNDYMTFPYKIKVDRCVGSFNDVNDPYSKVCVPDIVKNVSVKVFNLISQQNELRKVKFHKSCRCDCLLNKIEYNDEQRWNKAKGRFEYLKTENCDNNFFFFGMLLIVAVNFLKKQLN